MQIFAQFDPVELSHLEVVIHWNIVINTEILSLVKLELLIKHPEIILLIEMNEIFFCIAFFFFSPILQVA